MLDGRLGHYLNNEVPDGCVVDSVFYNNAVVVPGYGFMFPISIGRQEAVLGVLFCFAVSLFCRSGLSFVSQTVIMSCPGPNEPWLAAGARTWL